MQRPNRTPLFTRPRHLLVALALLFVPLFGLAATPALAAPSCVTSGATVTCTFGYTGAPDTWTVPAGVTSATFDLYGAQGGRPTNYQSGGLGGRVTATLAVTPGATYQIRVGGQGGFNGGGEGGRRGLIGRDMDGGWGGGASDVRTGAFGLADRLLVAGGGGGAGDGYNDADTDGIHGGAGGYPSGGSGEYGGGGGSQTAGGGGGGNGYENGSAGSLGQGGGGGGNTGYSGGGGGGGYYGGGGGASEAHYLYGGGGGGGSSYVTWAATNVSYQNGVQTLNGRVVISYPLPDSTAPVITPTASGTQGANGWYTSDVQVTWGVVDSESAISSKSGCDTQSVTSDTAGVTFTCTATSAGGTTSQSVTITRDATKPTITFANRTAPNAAGWNNSEMTVNWTCSDATSGAASASVSQTLSSEGANQSASDTCADQAGNTASDTQAGINIDTTAPTLSPVVSPSTIHIGQSATASPHAADALSGIASQGCGALDTSTAGTKSVSCTATDLAGNSATATASYEVLAAIFPATGVLDSFTRANGGVGSNWEGLTSTSFYKIVANTLDVQLGGPLVWKTSFGSTQEAFVTLATIDPRSPSQGVLLKVQTGKVPDTGAISVVYDAVAKAVRVSALRLGTKSWTFYPTQAATFASGDVLGARANADGTVEIYKNGTLVTTVTLNAADQAFFNSTGGKVGIWAAAAPNAVFDDFGGGTVNP